MALTEALRAELTELLTTKPVVLFMKGTRRAPACGFSARVVQILDEIQVDFADVNVLESPELRDGIKEFSNWPTIPQLYVKGKFVGGADIVTELQNSGELEAVFGLEASAPATPKLEITKAAAEAFAAALSEGDEALHLRIDAGFENELFFGPREAGETELSASGVTLLVDRSSLRRADGLKIDFVAGAEGGFRLENPNAPARVKQLSAPELKAMLDRGAINLFDVRPEAERRIASIAGARPLDAAGQEYLESLDRNAPIALHCHHGVRSLHAAEQLIASGFRNVYNLKGGVAAWSTSVDPSVPEY